MVKVAILCGGIGSRLWPLSRKSKPKQFIKLPNDEYNLFQQTILRINSLKLSCSELIIISNKDIQNDILESTSRLDLQCKISYIWEEITRNTGPAICTLLLYLHDSTEPCIIWPSDHIIDIDSFNESLSVADGHIHDCDYIITFGIKPLYAEPGYGYIISDENFTISKFIEKPPLDISEELIKNPNCYWNSGIFYFKPCVVLEEYRIYHPEMLCLLGGVMCLRKGHLDNHYYIGDGYKQCPDIGFDKLIMEKTKRGIVIPFNGKWSDIGSWDVFFKMFRTGDTNVVQYDNNNCYIYNTTDQLICAIGLKDVFIVNTQDALLISDFSQAQKVKDVYQQLSSRFT